MRKEIFIVSNNPSVTEKYPSVGVGGDIEAVFRAVRDLVHQGCLILTHPLSGSIKPHETEYKSVILEHRSGPVDPRSLELIEAALAAGAKFRKPRRAWGPEEERVDADFRAIDLSLLETGLEGLGRTLYKLTAFGPEKNKTNSTG